jgi:DNA-binding SARP family transcriptional activator/TolB-like protein
MGGIRGSGTVAEQHSNTLDFRLPSDGFVEQSIGGADLAAPNRRTAVGACVSMPNIVRSLPSEGARYAGPMPGSVVVRLSMLGPMHATTVLGADVLPRSKRGRAILAMLAFAEDGTMTRRALADVLWPRVAPDQALNSLRQELPHLRARFADLPPGTFSVERHQVTLAPDRCWVDALALGEHAHDETADAAAALALCRGDFLAGLTALGPAFEAWRQSRVEHLHAAVNVLVQREIAHFDRSGTIGTDLLDTARRLTRIVPASEQASQWLMGALLRAGDRGAAVEEFERLERVLANAHRLTPSEETRALAALARSGPIVSTMSTSVAATSPTPDGGRGRQRSRRRGARWRLRVLVAPFIALGSLHDPSLPAVLSQDVAAALARFRWFDVIVPMGEGGSAPAHSSSRAVEGARWRREVPDYVLDATIVQRTDGVRVLSRLLLMDGDAASVVWDSEIDLPEDQLSEFSTQVTARIVARVDPQILFIEGARLEAGGEKPSSATEMVLRAIPMMYRFDRAEFDAAGALLSKALAIDPNCAKAASWRAYWLLFLIGQGWAENPRARMDEAEALCLQALRIDPANAEAMGIFAHVLAFVHKDLEGALELFDRALHLNPNLAMVWALSAPVHCYVGKPDDALTRLDRYRDLAPNDPYFSMFETMYTIAHLMRHDYERAIATGQRGVRNNPGFTNGYKPLLAALGHTGRSREAAEVLATLLRLEPDFSIERFRQVYPLKRARDLNHYVVGLRKAGVPEKSSLPDTQQSKEGACEQ